jgi:anthranilate phosphoribosyltransferase
MHDHLHAALKLILERRETLTRAQSRTLLEEILTNPTDQLRIAALLGALASRGETTEELAGFVEALRARSIRIPLTPAEQALAVDTCGTGGDLSGTFNISTAAGLVAAAAGALIAKHGNRTITSHCGSADVLEALRIPVDLTPEQAAESLRKHRFAFLPAPALQPAMKSIMPIRRALGVRTAFNILGPMTNPAGAAAQVMGVYAPHLVPIAANVLAALNTRHAFVVHGYLSEDPAAGGHDELSISGPSTIAEIRGSEVHLSTVTPTDFGLPLASNDALLGGNATTNAAILRAIFAGEPGPRRDVVVMNASAALVVAGLSPDFRSGAQLAQQTIDSGAVTRLVTSLSQNS